MTDRFRRTWHLWLPVAALLLLCLPRVGSLLPAPVDFSDEIYQPMQGLRFLSTHGTDFAKYGPIPNYLLCPFYGATLAYWKITGTLGKPSGDWPYGLAHPVEQLGLLVLETRLICLTLMCVMVAALSSEMARFTASRAAAGLMALGLIVGNYLIVWNAPLARPDQFMLVFMGLTFAVLLRIAAEGLTAGRAIWFAIFSASSVGSKENAGPVLVLAFLAMVMQQAYLARRDRATLRLVFKNNGICVAAGIIFYALTNIALSPSVWVKRMRFWLLGDGLSGDVWGRSGSWHSHIEGVLGAIWNNVGPLGAIAVPLLLIVAIVRRPGVSAVLLLPAAGALATLIAIPYTPDRFVLPLALLLAILAGIGLGEALRTNWSRPALALMTATACVNLVWATLTWHINASNGQYVMNAAVAKIDPKTSISVASMFANSTGLRQLAAAGHTVDLRAMQDWNNGAAPMPQVVFSNSGQIKMYEQARTMPGRAAYYRTQNHFEISKWPGMAGMGYGPPEVIPPPEPPLWLRPFSFMPVMRSSGQHNGDVLIYRRSAAAAS